MGRLAVIYGELGTQKIGPAKSTTSNIREDHKKQGEN